MIQLASSTNGTPVVPSPTERSELANLYLTAIHGLLPELSLADLDAVFQMLVDNIENVAGTNKYSF